MSNFLGISDKFFLVTGFANRKSVAWHVSNILEKEGYSSFLKDISHSFY